MENRLKIELLNLKEQYKDEPQTYQAYSIIRKAIVTLLLKPKESFLEREIAELIEMGRTPVHEALLLLESDDWIHIIPRKGFMIDSISEDIIREISYITAALEGVAVELATDRIGKNEYEKLEELIRLQENAMYTGDLKDYVIIDHEFHNRIIEYSGSERLKKVMKSNSDQLFRARLFTINERPLPLKSIKEHQAIISAMKAGNESAARILLETHRKEGSKEVLKILNEAIK